MALAYSTHFTCILVILAAAATASPGRLDEIWNHIDKSLPDPVMELQPLMKQYGDESFSFLQQGPGSWTQTEIEVLRDLLRQLLSSESNTEWRLALLIMLRYPQMADQELLLALWDHAVCADSAQFARPYRFLLQRASRQMRTSTDTVLLHRCYNEIMAASRLSDLSTDLLHIWSELMMRCAPAEIDSLAGLASMQLTSIQWSAAFFDLIIARITASLRSSLGLDWIRLVVRAFQRGGRHFNPSTGPRSANTHGLSNRDTTPVRSSLTQETALVNLRDTLRKLLDPEIDSLYLGQYVADVLIEFALRCTSISDMTWIDAMLSKQQTWPSLCLGIRGRTGVMVGRGLRDLFQYWFGLGKIRNERILQHMTPARLRMFVRTLLESYRQIWLRTIELDQITTIYGKLFHDVIQLEDGGGLLSDASQYDHDRHPMTIAREITRVAVSLAKWFLFLDQYKSVTQRWSPDEQLTFSESLSVVFAVSRSPPSTGATKHMQRACFDLVAASVATVLDRSEVLPLRVIRDPRWNAPTNQVSLLGQACHSPALQPVFEWADLLWALLKAPQFVAQLQGPGRTPVPHTELLVWIYVRLTVQQQRTICDAFQQYRYAMVPHWMEPAIIHDNDTEFLHKVIRSGTRCRICNGPLIPTGAVSIQDVRPQTDMLPLVELRCGHYLHAPCAGQLRLRTPAFATIYCPVCQAVVQARPRHSAIPHPDAVVP